MADNRITLIALKKEIYMSELCMDSGPPKNMPAEIKVELCFTAAPSLDEALKKNITEALGGALNAYGVCPVSELAPKPGRYGAGILIMPGSLPPGENGLPGLAVTFGDSPTAPDNPDVLQSLSQTWQWDDAEAIVPAAPFRVTLASVNSADLPLARRIDLLQKALYALTGLLRPDALIFPQSQCCIDPDSYLENNPAGDDYFPIYGLVNARIFTAEEEDGKSVFMDTLGMHILGLPDAQCLASDEETDFAELAYWLYNLADYMRDNPGGFEDGDTIVGLNDEEWELGYNSALIEPERCVLNVNTMQIDMDDLEFIEDEAE